MSHKNMADLLLSQENCLQGVTFQDSYTNKHTIQGS